jgi:ribosome-associated protein
MISFAANLILLMKQAEKAQKFTPLVLEIVEGMEDVKAKNITVLDLRDIENAVSEFFIIAEGTSNTQVNAIVNSAEKRVREQLGDKPWHVEGSGNAEWVLMDYVNVVAHVFQSEVRAFYDLESLWGDAVITKIEQ